MLFRSIRELGEAITFRDEAAERMNIIRWTEARELAEGRAAMEVCKSQVQIAWDQHEKLSDQIKAVQNELAENKGALDQEKKQFKLHQRGDNELLLQIVETLAALGVSGLPILRPNHSHSLSHYLAFLEHVASLICGAKGSVSKATRRAGEKAAWKVATQFIAALHQRYPPLSLLSELEGVTPRMLSDPKVTRQADEVIKHLSREDDQ